jgi:hypothetical protein
MVRSSSRRRSHRRSLSPLVLNRIQTATDIFHTRMPDSQGLVDRYTDIAATLQSYPLGLFYGNLVIGPTKYFVSDLNIGRNLDIT